MSNSSHTFILESAGTMSSIVLTANFSVATGKLLGTLGPR